MEYFISHIGIIFLAAIFVAAAAVAWWALTERNAKLIRQRAVARQKAKEGQDASRKPAKDKENE